MTWPERRGFGCGLTCEGFLQRVAVPHLRIYWEKSNFADLGDLEGIQPRQHFNSGSKPNKFAPSPLHNVPTKLTQRERACRCEAALNGAGSVRAQWRHLVVFSRAAATRRTFKSPACWLGVLPASFTSHQSDKRIRLAPTVKMLPGLRPFEICQIYKIGFFSIYP